MIKNAFGCFDEDNVGALHEDRLRELLTTIGDRFTDDEVRSLMMRWRAVTCDLEQSGPGAASLCGVMVAPSLGITTHHTASHKHKITITQSDV